MKSCPPEVDSRGGTVRDVLLSTYQILCPLKLSLTALVFASSGVLVTLWSECQYRQEAGWQLVTHMTSKPGSQILNPAFSTHQLCDLGYSI